MSGALAILATNAGSASSRERTPSVRYNSDVRWLSPEVWSSRSSTVIGRAGGRGAAPGAVTTCTAANSGRYLCTGSSSRKRPSSCSIIAATAVTALVIE